MKNPPLNETPEQKKARLQREADALFQDINASFGRPVKKAKEPKKPAEPALTTFLKECNAIAKAMESPTWRPVAIVHYIIKQQRACCGQAPECIGGTLVRHSHSKRQDTWDFPRPDVNLFSHLPQVIIEETTKVDFCPDCIRQGYFDKSLHAELPEQSPVGEWMNDTDDSGESLIIDEE